MSPMEPANSSARTQLEEDFITQLQTLPELWQAQHKHYTNKYKRQAGYKKLLEILKKIKPQATVDDVRKKINSLRSNYRRELRKSCIDEFYTPKAKSFKLLSFLNTSEELNSSHQNQQLLGVTGSRNAGSSQENLNEPANPAPETSFSSISQVVQPPKNIFKENELIDRASLFMAQTSLQSQKLFQGTKTSHSLALIWAEKLDNLHPQQRFFAEKAIHDILFEAGLGTLHRYSVKINEPEMKVTSLHCKASPLFTQDDSSPSYSVPNSPTPSDMQP
ncbi:uncharacterized protein LOC113494889 [Trichoplusia ni]|uniref:Uncharacterized protein LOC113494889 n=1 Tax=Trichoplusia ni TaxID=7111 RepID=A0A7E5VLN4_TRINI|nr:uncharacterized protein LOC113494889 [Trichoplusia ni]